MSRCVPMDTVTVLDRDVFSEAGAARLLRVAPSTLHYWLEGKRRGSSTFPPVIRVEPRNQPRGQRTVTWAEFVEAGMLRAYRREHDVPMRAVRRFIDYLRDEYDVPYPLAHERPLVHGRELVLRAQEQAQLDASFWLVYEASGGQLLLTPSGDEFLRRVEFTDGLASAWRPAEDAASPVRVNPLMRSGRPHARGISTEVLREHVEAGEDPAEIAADFGLTVQDVDWALAYEFSIKAAS